MELPKGLLLQVAALNTVKAIMDDRNLFSANDFLQKYKTQNGLNILIDETAAMLKLNISLESQNKIKNFFLKLLLTADDLNAMIEAIRKMNIFSDVELTEIKNQRSSKELTLPAIATMIDWKMGDLKSEFI